MPARGLLILSCCDLATARPDHRSPAGDYVFYNIGIPIINSRSCIDIYYGILNLYDNKIIKKVQPLFLTHYNLYLTFGFIQKSDVLI